MPRYFLFAALLVALPAAATSVERPPQLGLCAACHGETGRAVTRGTPHLAGQDEGYLIAAMDQYRAGQRRNAVMRAATGSLSPADVAAFARWYAAQAPGGEAR